MIESRLRDLADDMLRRSSAPRVLDYATPVPRRPWADYARDALDLFRGHPCLWTFIAGNLVMYVGAAHVPPGAGVFVMFAGALVVQVAMRWWGSTPSQW